MIGERLAEVRKDHHDTQHSLAEKLNVTHHTVSSWEQGKSSPSNEMLAKICRMYNVSSNYLLCLTDVDPAYIHRQRLELFSKDELDELKDFEEYLLWKKGR